MAILGAPNVTVTRIDGKIRAPIGRELFAEIVTKGAPKPYIYPVFGPTGKEMTRAFPMKIRAGEAKDHPHHRSIWFAHGDVNGVDFWHEGEGAGKIVVKRSRVSGSSAELTCDWIGPDQKKIADSVFVITFGVHESGDRFIDWDIRMKAAKGQFALDFGDTKEGTFAVRTHPSLRLTPDPAQGVDEVNGRARNSEGINDKDVWGKAASWIDYYGMVGGSVAGIAIYDHPNNPTFPTWWHAREYGLVAANPFGAKAFTGESRGNVAVLSDSEIRFRYRVLLHKGAWMQAKVGERWSQWALSGE